MSVFAKPAIRYVRPLHETPNLHRAIATTFRSGVDPTRAQLIGADAKEYVYVPGDAHGFYFLEAVCDADGDYTLLEVAPERARALFKAAREFREGAAPAISLAN